VFGQEIDFGCHAVDIDGQRDAVDDFAQPADQFDRLQMSAAGGDDAADRRCVNSKMGGEEEPVLLRGVQPIEYPAISIIFRSLKPS
jgi:hypothetical protein